MNAPVMMHSLDEGGRLLRVNRRWAQELGYEPRDVLGRAGIDFLTEPSRAWAIRDTLPLFWKALRARSVGYEFFRADGGVLEALLDADAPRGPDGNMRSYAAIRRPHDIAQYEQAHTVLSLIYGLSLMKARLAAFQLPLGEDLEQRPREGSELSSARVALTGPEREALGETLELARDVSSSLRGLLNAVEESLGSSAEQQRELLTVARSIDRTLASLSDAGTQFAQGGGSENPGKDL